MNPLAVVLDTNVIVAAMRSRQGCSFRIIDDFMTRKPAWEWNISNSSVLEYEEVLLKEGVPPQVVDASSFKAAGAVTRIRKVVLERGEQERAEFTFEPVDAGKRPMFDHVQEKTLGQVLGVIRRMPAASSENVERIPIEPARLG